MSEAQIIAKLNALEQQIESVRVGIHAKLDTVICDSATTRSGVQVIVTTFSGMSAAIQDINDLVTALSAVVDALPTADNTTTIGTTGTGVSQIASAVNSIDAQLAAFDPVIISDLAAQFEDLTEKLGDVPTNSSIWAYLQGVSNIDADATDTAINTTVTGNISSDDGAICNALVEMLNGSSEVVGQTYSETDGDWSIVVDAGATYTVHISVPGYNPFTSTVTIPAGATAYTVS